MQEWLEFASRWVESSGFFAPLLFIALHACRPLLFLPVPIVCLLGGMLFGFFTGTLLSLIGMWLVCEWFYWGVKSVPWIEKRFQGLQKKYAGHRQLTLQQITILRLLPFVHFHLMSLCVMKLSASASAYRRSSLYTIVPSAAFYTLCGKWLYQMSVPVFIVFAVILIGLAYSLRQRRSIVSWSEFFASPRVRSKE
ncbi:TVP38/TMEM64 family protein [Aureibacillus halotolerans]|uniref:TVP38/TMEM64 family membrane protein n=1 Tax=Aureibacillus halotolerans TaxID=1508390 RepID=A0A4R6U407_9BACI|nr:TVP38/TMEM64 family protein [Aureibacillus halotolerans]TDQ39165.1 putative membrane protein YdjX (TVP38/TMEM64 family) [Aureibacillus halotolerans]